MTEDGVPPSFLVNAYGEVVGSAPPVDQPKSRSMPPLKSKSNVVFGGGEGGGGGGLGDGGGGEGEGGGGEGEGGGGLGGGGEGEGGGGEGEGGGGLGGDGEGG